MLRILVALLLAVLEGGTVEERERAFALLWGLLPAAEPLIRAQVDHPDPELRARCRKLLAPSPLDSPAIGKLAFIDADRRRVAGDLRPRDGAREGLGLVVRRDGRRIGSVVVTESHAWGCWLSPGDGPPAPDFRRGDTLHWR